MHDGDGDGLIDKKLAQIMTNKSRSSATSSYFVLKFKLSWFNNKNLFLDDYRILNQRFHNSEIRIIFNLQKAKIVQVKNLEAKITESIDSFLCMPVSAKNRTMLATVLKDPKTFDVTKKVKSKMLDCVYSLNSNTLDEKMVLMHNPCITLFSHPIEEEVFSMRYADVKPEYNLKHSRWVLPQQMMFSLTNACDLFPKHFYESIKTVLYSNYEVSYYDMSTPALIKERSRYLCLYENVYNTHIRRMEMLTNVLPSDSFKLADDAAYVELSRDIIYNDHTFKKGMKFQLSGHLESAVWFLLNHKTDLGVGIWKTINEMRVRFSDAKKKMIALTLLDYEPEIDMDVYHTQEDVTFTEYLIAKLSGIRF
jgi:hypothetical protein